MTTIEREAPPQALSLEMQSIARNYIGARQRAGSAWLETARYLAEARQAAKYGEWKIFLEATQTSADSADRLLAIHDQAARDPQYRLAIQNNFLNVSTAYELTTAPPEQRAQLLGQETPPTRAQIREIKRGPNSAPARTFDQAEMFDAPPANPNYSDVAPAALRTAPFWATLTVAHPTAHHWTEAHHNEYHAACGMRAYHDLVENANAGHCSSCVRATWPQNQAESAPVGTPATAAACVRCGATRAERQALTSYGRSRGSTSSCRRRCSKRATSGKRPPRRRSRTTMAGTAMRRPSKARSSSGAIICARRQRTTRACRPRSC
jgi:hypothetical protein